MKLTQVKGSTWVLEANELIPLYLLDDRRCVLLDSGLAKERGEERKCHCDRMVYEAVELLEELLGGE